MDMDTWTLDIAHNGADNPADRRWRIEYLSHSGSYHIGPLTTAQAIALCDAAAEAGEDDREGWENVLWRWANGWRP